MGYSQKKCGIRDFLLYCKTIDFGKSRLSNKERHFYRRFTNEILSLCRSLPDSIRTDSMLFFMQYSEVNLGDEFDFFANYYTPAWSILYWLSHDSSLPAKRLTKGDVTSAITAQSMAMLIHSLDNHLTDNQVAVSPLSLLLRSQAWTIMNRALGNLVEGVPAAKRTVRRLMDDYYSSLQESKGLKSLDGYCHLFRRQMGIGMIAPILLSTKMARSPDFTKDIQTAYGSFGIAWRLLDDIHDIGEDLKSGAESSIYLCLSKPAKTQWKSNIHRNRAVGKSVTKNILMHILEKRIIDTLKVRICAELETAASMVEAHNLRGFAREFRCLAHPIRNSDCLQEEHHGRTAISQTPK